MVQSSALLKIEGLITYPESQGDSQQSIFLSNNIVKANINIEFNAAQNFSITAFKSSMIIQNSVIIVKTNDANTFSVIPKAGKLQIMQSQINLEGSSKLVFCLSEKIGKQFEINNSTVQMKIASFSVSGLIIIQQGNGLITESTITGELTGTNEIGIISNLVSGQIMIKFTTINASFTSSSSAGIIAGKFSKTSMITILSSNFKCIVSGKNNAGVYGKLDEVTWISETFVNNTGVISSCTCENGACQRSCYVPTIEIKGFPNKNVVLSFVVYYALGGDNDWNNTNIVYVDSLTIPGQSGTFDNYESYYGIDISGSLKSTATDSYFGGVLAVSNQTQKIEKITMRANLNISVDSYMGGLVGVIEFKVDIINCLVSGSLDGFKVAGVVYRITSQEEVTMTNTTISSRIDAVSWASCLICYVLRSKQITIQSTIINDQYMAGKDYVAAISYIQYASTVTIDNLETSAYLSGTKYVASLVSYLTSDITLKFSNVNAKGTIFSWSSPEAGALIAYAESGATFIWSDVNSTVSGQFSRCPINANSPAQIPYGGYNC